jgi:hypothetical protein
MPAFSLQYMSAASAAHRHWAKACGPPFPDQQDAIIIGSFYIAGVGR